MFAFLHRQKPVERSLLGGSAVTQLQNHPTKVPAAIIEPGYSSIDEIKSDMAARRLVPPTNKSKSSDGLLNYAELVFDEETDKPK